MPWLTAVPTLQTLQDYERACRKAVLDYVLRHESERQRLGVPLPPLAPQDWGWRDFTSRLEPSKEWRDRVAAARTSLAAKLFLYTPLVSGLMQEWRHEWDSGRAFVPDVSPFVADVAARALTPQEFEAVRTAAVPSTAFPLLPCRPA